MPPPQPPTRNRFARVRRIRRSVVAFGTAVFLAVWGVVYVQMSNGRDPALGRGQTAAVTKAASTGTGSSTTSDDTASTGSSTSSDGTSTSTTASASDSTDTSGSAATSSSSSPSAITTHAS